MQAKHILQLIRWCGFAREPWIEALSLFSGREENCQTPPASLPSRPQTLTTPAVCFRTAKRSTPTPHPGLSTSCNIPLPGQKRLTCHSGRGGERDGEREFVCVHGHTTFFCFLPWPLTPRPVPHSRRPRRQGYLSKDPMSIPYILFPCHGSMLRFRPLPAGKS